MKLIQTLPLVSMSISLYVAFFHFYMYIRKIGNRTNLSFSLVCLYLFFYSWLCYLNYNETDFYYNVIWLKLIYFTFLFFPITFIHFAYDFTNQESRKLPWILTGIVIVATILMFVLFFSPANETPVFIPVDFIDFSYVTFQGDGIFEMVRVLVVGSSFTILIYGIWLIFKYYRSGNPVARPILIGALLFFLCGVNETFVEFGVYSFLFLSEYGGMFLILGMAYAMIDQMAKNNDELSQIRVLSAVGKMATEVVHDLTTPLAAIKLAASIARKNGNGAETQTKYLSLIEHETRRLSDLSNDILQFVNSDNPVHIKRVDLKEYLDDALIIIEGEFSENQVDLRVNLSYEGPVYLDPDAFRRIIYNLAANARESFESQPASDHTPEFVIGVHKQAKHLVFTFRDNGPGIPVDIKHQIFEPFSTYGKKYGTGLGLAISKQIVDLHGGHISCDSETQKGTTIQVSLPASLNHL